MERLSKSINVLNDVAMGRRKSDLVLDGCSLVSVYTGEIVPDTQVAVVNGRIAYVGFSELSCRYEGDFFNL